MTRRFTPYDRPRRRFPMPVIGLLLLLGLISLVFSRVRYQPLLGVDALGAAVVGVWMAAWAEQRWFLQLVGRSPSTRIAGALGPVGLCLFAGVGLPALVGPEAVLGLMRRTPLTGPLLLGTALFLGWLSSAACGTLVVVGLELAVSAIARGFRQRLMLALLGLQLATLLLLLVVIAVVGSFRPIADPLPELDRAYPLLAPLLRSKTFWAVAIPAAYALVSLPAFLSLAGKTADSAMDRIHPLRRALDAMARGERDIELEEGGAEDFVVVARAFNGLVSALAKAEKMERAFGLYAGGILLEKIRSQHGEATLMAAQREATVFFADIRGFSTMSERLSAAEILSLLNRWFERVVAVVDEHEGYLNKFVGDAVVVVFNGPVDQPDHPSRAVRCARALQAEAARLNEEGHFPEIGKLEIGIGIATGPMICGNVGASERQMEYTVIGDTVNLASRLTGRAAPGEIWMSDVTAQGLPAELKAEPLDPVQVKGKEKPVVPWRLLAA